MPIPMIRGVLDRRISINYRVDPAVLARLLPRRLRPRLVRGVGMAGVCLSRLQHVRPCFLPACLGISSLNAIHWIATEWDQDREVHQGFFVLRRDTSSRLAAFFSGWLGPGAHHHAHFLIEDEGDYHQVILDSDDGHAHLRLEGHTASELPATSVFRTPAAASVFIQQGSHSDAVTGSLSGCEVLAQRGYQWQVVPLAITRMESSFFGDRTIFPAGTVEFDSALLMQNVEQKQHQKMVLFEVCRRVAGLGLHTAQGC